LFNLDAVYTWYIWLSEKITHLRHYGQVGEIAPDIFYQVGILHLRYFTKWGDYTWDILPSGEITLEIFYQVGRLHLGYFTKWGYYTLETYDTVGRLSKELSV